MKVSLAWIEELIGQKLDRKKAVELIGSRLAEVDSVIEYGSRFKDVVVAEITHAEHHPDADKLGVYQINTGKGKAQVVAGDRSLKVGNKIAYIPPGVAVPSSVDSEPFVLEEKELRGKLSQGMLASEFELGFSEEHEGVLVLDDEAGDIGTPLSQSYMLDDTVLDIENKTLTHRPDCFGLLGFAREVAAIFDIKFKSPNWYELSPISTSQTDELKIEIDNQAGELCPQYVAVGFKNIKIGPSSIAMKSMLNRLDVRPINNLVDVSNYYMLLSGQPTHMFDYDKISNGKIIIRTPKQDERLTLLDGKEIKLEKDEVLICDENGPIALGGVMGGANSEISDKTVNAVLEVANFDMYSIRATSMRHGIFSEAVTRFSRGQSQFACIPVTKLMSSELQKNYGLEIASNIIASSEGKYPEKSISFDDSKINSLLGSELSLADMSKTLSLCEIEVKENIAEIPFWRNDLNIWQDLAEEIGRINGFDKIKSTLPKRDLKPSPYDTKHLFRKSLRQRLIAAGANELLTYSGISEKMANAAGYNKEGMFKIRNSRSPELEYMRPALVASLISKVHINHKQKHQEFVLFEQNEVHSKNYLDQEESSLPQEQSRLALVYSSNVKKDASAFYHPKIYLETLLRDSETPTYLPLDSDVDTPLSETKGSYTQNRAAFVELNGSVIAILGELSAKLKKTYKLPDSCAALEIDLDALQSVLSSELEYKKLPSFPGVDRDLTYEVEATKYTKIYEAIKMFLSKLEKVSYRLDPIDIFAQNKDTSLLRYTFSLTLWHEEKTLESSEVNAWVNELEKYLSSELGARQI